MKYLITLIALIVLAGCVATPTSTSTTVLLGNPQVLIAETIIEIPYDDIQTNFNCNVLSYNRGPAIRGYDRNRSSIKIIIDSSNGFHTEYWYRAPNKGVRSVTQFERYGNRTRVRTFAPSTNFRRSHTSFVQLIRTPC